MGICCEINLSRCYEDGYPPGSTVSGLVKYAVDEETVFNNIIISLKGHADITVTDKDSKKDGERYWDSKTILDIDTVVNNDKKGSTFAAGSYEVPFSFILPEKIPPSLKLMRDELSYKIDAYIMYYVRIKFERPGKFKLNKHFRKSINVLPTITAKLPQEPIVYGEQKSLLKLFSSKQNIVNIKATVASSVVKPGESVHINYEVNNDTKVKVKGVTIKLVEEFKFPTISLGNVYSTTDIQESKSGSIPSREVKTFEEEIIIPADAWSVDHIEMILKDYILCITVNLPFPHIDLTIRVPMQIGIESADLPAIDGPPPSYWEAMGEEDDDMNIDKNIEGGDKCDTVKHKK